MRWPSPLFVRARDDSDGDGNERRTFSRFQACHRRAALPLLLPLSLPPSRDKFHPTVSAHASMHAPSLPSQQPSEAVIRVFKCKLRGLSCSQDTNFRHTLKARVGVEIRMAVSFPYYIPHPTAQLRSTTARAHAGFPVFALPIIVKRQRPRNGGIIGERTGWDATAALVTLPSSLSPLPSLLNGTSQRLALPPTMPTCPPPSLPCSLPLSCFLGPGSGSSTSIASHALFPSTNQEQIRCFL